MKTIREICIITNRAYNPVYQAMKNLEVTKHIREVRGQKHIFIDGPDVQRLIDYFKSTDSRVEKLRANRPKRRFTDSVRHILTAGASDYWG